MWPDIPYEPWRETCSALHLYSQVVGKYRLACTPWVNHSWHATLYVNARGLTTSIIPDGAVGVDGQDGEDYAVNLLGNLQSLLNRAKSGTYQAPPVRRAYIPKAGSAALFSSVGYGMGCCYD